MKAPCVWFHLLSCLSGLLLCPSLSAQVVPVESLSVEGKANADGGKLVITAELGETAQSESAPVVATQIKAVTEIAHTGVSHELEIRFTILAGTPAAIELPLTGDAEIVQVDSAAVRQWHIQHRSRPEGGESRHLVLQLRDDLEAPTIEAVVRAHEGINDLPATLAPFGLAGPEPALTSGSVRLSVPATLRVEANGAGLAQVANGDPENLAFHFAGDGYGLVLAVRRAVKRPIEFRDFELTARPENGALMLDLRGKVVVADLKGATLPLLKGEAALAAIPELEGLRVTHRDGAYRLVGEAVGTYPVHFEIIAKVTQTEQWASASFEVVPSALRPVDLQVNRDTIAVAQMAGVPMEHGERGFTGYLAPNAPVELGWRTSRDVTTTAAMFYTARGFGRIDVGVGLVRQTWDLVLNLSQGSTNQFAFDLAAEGEVVRVEGADMLSWQVEAQEDQRRLVVLFNQHKTNEVRLTVHTQTPLGTLPDEVTPVRLAPVDALRFGGYLSVRGDGAVSVEAVNSLALAQISPSRLPDQAEDDPPQLAFRFSSADYHLTVQANRLVPEVSASTVLIYKLEPDSQSLRAEIELDVRRAPLRDLSLLAPLGFALVNVQAPGLADYVVTSEGDRQRLRLVFGEPISGRRLVTLEWERDAALPDSWPLPRPQVLDLASFRGFAGITSSEGLRVSAERLEGAGEISASSFPQRLDNLQVALRLRASDWAARLVSQKLPSTVQAEVLHLHSLGEDTAYGSTLVNLFISGSPVRTLRLQVPENHANLSVVGRDLRSWRPVEPGVIQVDLHRPVSGNYTLLATHERPLEAQTATLTLGAVQVDNLDTERGYVIAVSDYPVEAEPILGEGSLLQLEPEEIPDEYRLLFDAKVVTAYEYTQRPFDLGLKLSPYGRQTTMNQVIDFAEAQTQLASDGQALTDIAYRIKSKGYPHFHFRMPDGTELWSVTVDGEKVTPVEEEGAVLAPLGHRSALEEPVTVNVRLASEGSASERLKVQLPVLAQPALLTQWTLRSDPGHQLLYLGGTLRPEDAKHSVSAMLLPVARIALIMGIVLALLGALAMMVRWRIFGILLWLAAGACLLGAGAIEWLTPSGERALSFQAPIDQAGAELSVEVAHLPTGTWHAGWLFWGTLLGGLVLLAYSRLFHAPGPVRYVLGVAAMSAILLAPLFVYPSSLVFVIVVGGSLALALLPVAHRSLRSPASAAGLLLALVLGAAQSSLEANPHQEPETLSEGVVLSLQQDLHARGSLLKGEARLAWAAEAGDTLTLLEAPAILQEVELPEGVSLHTNKNGEHVVVQASQAGTHVIQVHYLAPIQVDQRVHSVALPLPPALTHQATLALGRSEVVVSSAQAVNVQELPSDGSPHATQYRFTFAPSAPAVITWEPLTRNFSQEATVFYVESFDLWQPMAGLIEGAHRIVVRPSQGQVAELNLRTPEGLTVTDVEAPKASWQFDPIERSLTVRFRPAQREPFSLEIRSQYRGGALPFTSKLEPLQVGDAAGQVGLVALATDEDVQLGEVVGQQVLGINLEDFPRALRKAFADESGEPTLRRAFRWRSLEGSLSFEVLPVEPDVRVTARDRVSLGDERTLLASNLEVDIRRTGVFSLSFPLPEGYNVESISGSLLSRWNEREEEGGQRVILHFNGKTEGRLQFAVSLTGPGLANAETYRVPRILLEEASRQRGTVTIIPELGYQLEPLERESVSQLDPQSERIREPGALLWRYLNADGRLRLGVEVIVPWIEAEQLHAVRMKSGIIEHQLEMLLQVENAGIRTVAVQLPEDAVGAQFTSPDLRSAERADSASGQWLLHLNQKKVGQIRINARWQQPTLNASEEVTIVGAGPMGVDQFLGFLTLEGTGRLQLRTVEASTLPPTLQPLDSSLILPRLQMPRSGSIAASYRATRMDYALPVSVVRREAAETLPAQVSAVELLSILADDGGLLTRLRVTLDPGDKPLLAITLPPAATFWFAFVNEQGARPWHEGEAVLIPLERDPLDPAASTVELYYTQAISVGGTKLKGSLEAPKLDLPMENITWNLYYPESWHMADWEGDLNLERVQRDNEYGWLISKAVSSESYQEVNATNNLRQIEKSGEQFLLGNELLEQGEQLRARRLFDNAASLSQGDAAFNEDARVQLQNVLEQQALVGITNRRKVLQQANGLAPQAAPEEDLMNFTDADAQRIIGSNAAEENASLRELVRHLIAHQQEGMGRPEALRIVLPETGRMVVFKRRMQVSQSDPLTLTFRGERPRLQGFPIGPWSALGIIVLATTLTILLFRPNNPTQKGASEDGPTPQ